MRPWLKLWASRVNDARVLVRGCESLGVYIRLLTASDEGWLSEPAARAFDSGGSIDAMLASGALVRDELGRIGVRDWDEDQIPTDAQRMRKACATHAALSRWSTKKQGLTTETMPDACATQSVTQCEGEGRRRERDQNEKRLPSEALCPPPPAAVTGSLFPASPEAPKPEKPKKPKREAPPLPWQPADLLPLIAQHGSDRFSDGFEPSSFTGGQKIQLYRLIRAFPDKARWAVLIAWLDAGGVPNLEVPYGLGILACDAVRNWMAMAAEWDRKGRFDLGEVRAEIRLKDRGAETLTNYYKNEFRPNGYSKNGVH